MALALNNAQGELSKLRDRAAVFPMAPHLRPLSVQSEYAPISAIAGQRSLERQRSLAYSVFHSGRCAYRHNPDL